MGPHFKYPLVIPATQKIVQKEVVKEFMSLDACLKMVERYPMSHVAPYSPSRTLWTHMENAHSCQKETTRPSVQTNVLDHWKKINYRLKTNFYYTKQY